MVELHTPVCAQMARWGDLRTGFQWSQEKPIIASDTLCILCHPVRFLAIAVGEALCAINLIVRQGGERKKDGLRSRSGFHAVKSNRDACRQISGPRAPMYAHFLRIREFSMGSVHIVRSGLSAASPNTVFSD